MLGLVTIGQSPRSDVVASMFQPTDGLQIVQAGALNSLTDAEITELAPRVGEHTLVTRCRDGREVLVAKERLQHLMQRSVNDLEAQGASVICVLCTGAFIGLSSKVHLIYPDQVLLGVVNAVLPSGVVGVLIPHPDQHDSMVTKWTTTSRSAITASISPYVGSGDPTSVVQDLCARGADLIVLDCMGYGRGILARARRASAVPVLLANGLTGSVLKELVGYVSGGNDEIDLL